MTRFQLSEIPQEFDNVYDVLEARGFLAQCNYPEELKEYLAKPGGVFYIGFDPTADALHVGHFVQIIIMMWMQRYGHKAIALMGGGTGMIGDPSGRQDLRKVLSLEQIDHNVAQFEKQMRRYLDFSDGKAEIMNNAQWLRDLNYIDFLREIGVHFSVNRMLTAECYKARLEQGLTFLEFNYMLMQAYDFLQLYRLRDCMIQFGGDDQWSNILAGTDLIRRKEGEHAFAQTFQLLTTASGQKMGKTAGNAIWIDENKTPPFEVYQYMRNVDDADVIKLLKIFTFLPLDEIKTYEKMEGQELNEAKTRLAYEFTRILHGTEAADQAKAQAEALFHGAGRSDDMDTVEVALGLELLDVLVDSDFLPSKSEGRRLIKQGGLYLNEENVQDFGKVLEDKDFKDGEAIVRRGKKRHLRLELKD